MSLFRSRGQANPQTEENVAAGELQAKVTRLAKALDVNSAAIHRWFWQAFFAFNLILWSVALCIAFLKRVA